MLKALEKEPAARFLNAGEMLSALLAYRELSVNDTGGGSSTKGTIEF